MFFCIHPTQSQSPHSQYSVFLWFYDTEPQNGSLSFELVEFMCLVFTRMPAEWSQAIGVFVDTLFLSMWHLLTTDVVCTLYLLACQVRVITGDSGLCWYIIHIDVTSSDHWCGMNLVFTRMPGESDHRWFGFLLLHYSCWCESFWPLTWYTPCIYSCAKWEWSQVIWVFVVTLFLFMWHLLTTDKVLFRSFQFIPSSKKTSASLRITLVLSISTMFIAQTTTRQLTLWHQCLAKRFR